MRKMDVMCDTAHTGWLQAVNSWGCFPNPLHALFGRWTGGLALALFTACAGSYLPSTHPKPSPPQAKAKHAWLTMQNAQNLLYQVTVK